MMTIRTKEAKEKEVKKAVKFAKKVGFMVDTYPRHTPGFKIISAYDKSRVISPIWFEIGEDKLVDIYHQIKTLGLSGKICLKALVDSWNELTKSQGDDLRNCCWVSSYSATDLLTFFYGWIISQLEKQRIQISSNISKNTTRNLWFSLGGYRGLKAFFVDGLEATLTEFRRIRQLEEKLETSSPITIDNPGIKKASEYTEYNPCLTCTKCRVDRYGCRKCSYCMVDIPENMTVREVNEIYPDAVINDCGKLRSQFIMHNPGSCQYRHERIGCKTRKTSSVHNKYQMVYND